MAERSANPWLQVPLEDYEGHMQLADVAQLDALSDLFAEALAICHPTSVAILGVAGGNGLDRIDRNITKRVVGIDINAAYLAMVRSRYPDLSVVLQLSSATTLGVASTPYESMRSLAPHFGLIDPACLRAMLESRGFPLMHETQRALPAGKAFWMGILSRAR